MLFRGRKNVATLEFDTCMKSFTDVLVGELKSLLNDLNSHDNIAFLSMLIESHNQQGESGIYRKFQDGS